MRGLKPAEPGMRLRRMTPTKLANAIALLTRGAWTVNRLAEAIDVSRHALNPHINALRLARPKILYVAEWEVTKESHPLRYVAAYSFGNQRDAERPAKKSQAQLCRESRARRKQRAIDAAVLGVRL